MTKKISYNFVITLLFSGFVALIPILQYYRSLLPAFNMATFIAIAFIPFLILLIFTKRNKPATIPSWPVYLYVVFLALNIVLTSSKYGYGYTWNNLNSYVRLLVLFLSIFLLGRRAFDIKIAFSFLEFVLVISSLLIFFSTLLKTFSGTTINFRIDSLLSDVNYSGTSNDRFSGLFMEPAHFAQSSIIYLSIALFNQNFKPTKKYKILIIVLGIIFSGSGQGYLFLAIILFLYLINFVYSMRKNQRSMLIFAGLVIVIGLSIPILYQLPFVKSAFGRIIGSDGGIGGAALAGRTYSNYVFDDLDSSSKIIGIGFGHAESLTKGYVNSLYRHLIECGYISIPFLFIMMIVPFLKGNKSARVYIVLFSLMLIFTGVWSPMTLFQSLIIIYLMPKPRKELVPNGKRCNFTERNRTKTVTYC